MITNKKIMMLATTDNMIWQFLIPHIKYLQSMGNIVECVCSKTGFWFDELKDIYGFTMHQIYFDRNPLKFKNIMAYKKLKRLQQQEKFDLIYCQQPVGGLMGRLVGRKFNIPVIYTVHGFHFFKGNNPIKNFIFKTIEKKLAKSTSALITINDEDYQAINNWKTKHKFKISGIGFDVNKYDNQKFDKREFKRSLGLKDGDFVVFTVAEYSAGKNYKTMLKTIAQLKDKNIKFVSCGNGKDEKKIKKQINKLNISDEVLLLGYRKDINKIMQVSDVFFLPSYREGLCLSIIEAMSFGLPIITSNVRGCKDLVIDTKNGFVEHPNNYKYFSEKIIQLTENVDLRKEMQITSKEMSKEYSIQNVQKQLEDIYRQL